MINIFIIIGGDSNVGIKRKGQRSLKMNVNSLDELSANQFKGIKVHSLFIINMGDRISNENDLGEFINSIARNVEIRDAKSFQMKTKYQRIEVQC